MLGLGQQAWITNGLNPKGHTVVGGCSTQLQQSDNPPGKIPVSTTYNSR
jgi:hypothetical protein